jgi:hypothetical protein
LSQAAVSSSAVSYTHEHPDSTSELCDPLKKRAAINGGPFGFLLMIQWISLVAAFRMLDGFVLFMRALDGMTRTHGFVVHLVNLTVHLAPDRVMPILVAFMRAMSLVDGIGRASCSISHLVGFFIGVAFDLRDLDTDNFLADVFGRREWRH